MSVHAPFSYLPFWGWQPVMPETLARVPVALRPWIMEPGSMTVRLQKHFGGPVRVRVLAQGRRPNGHMVSGASGLPWGGPVWVRDVALEVGGRVVLCARTITPLGRAGRVGRLMRTLGTRPLGHVLFEMPGVVQGGTELIRLGPNAPLLRRFRKTMPTRQPTWARRTVHWIHDHPLAVVELFVAKGFLVSAR